MTRDARVIMAAALLAFALPIDPVGGEDMTKRHLPSVEALLDSDDELLSTELKVREVREQVAVARSLLDEVEDVAQAEIAAAELARLGCKIVELASAIKRAGTAPVSSVTPISRAC